MAEHRLITDPHLHEPKGISTAPEGYVYVADGSGTGAWTPWPYGKAYYQHSLTGQVINTTPTKLEIDGLGALTYISRLPREIRGVQDLWDTALNRITPVRVGDGYVVRIDMPVTAEAGSPVDIRVQLDAGGGVSPSLVLYEMLGRAGRATPYTLSFTTTFDILTSTVATNGIALFANSNTGTVTLGSPAIYVQKTTDGLL